MGREPRSHGPADVISWAADLPSVVGAGMSAIVAISLGLLSYAAARWLLGRRADERSSDLAINMFRILATLLALLLSLTFADLREGINVVRGTVEAEAGALGNTLRDLEAIDDARSRDASRMLTDYIESVIENEWDGLGRGHLDRETMDLFGRAKQAIYALEPATPVEERVHARLIADIDTVHTTRVARLVHRGESGRLLFLYIALIGFVSTTSLLSIYPPQGKALYFISIYSGFFGVVIYVILQLGRFFDGLGAVTPEPLEYLLTLARERAR